MATKIRAATVRVMFKVAPGGMQSELTQWMEHVKKALEAYKHEGSAPCCYADFEVIDAMLIDEGRS